jgi:hypothetical protein
MNFEQETEALFISDAIEEPPLVVEGEGSGRDLNVGNEGEKKKIFFFGQPGCLKNSPVKTNSVENHTNNHKSEETASVAATSEIENTQKQPSDDEDSDSLLKKISEALNSDETDKAASKTSEDFPPTSN